MLPEARLSETEAASLFDVSLLSFGTFSPTAQEDNAPVKIMVKAVSTAIFFFINYVPFNISLHAMLPKNLRCPYYKTKKI